MDTLTQHANILEDIITNYLAGIDAMTHLQGVCAQIGHLHGSLSSNTWVEEVADDDDDVGFGAESSTFYTVMSSTNNSIPTLNSLIAWADALMKSPPAADTDFLVITVFFNEAVTIKCSLLVYYSSSSHVNFYHNFEQFISRLVIQFHFTDQWLSVFCVETTHLWTAANGSYHLTGDQILGGLEVLSATKSILGSPKSTSGGSPAVMLKDTSITPARSGSPSPTSGSASLVSSADWMIPSSMDPAPFIKPFAETEGTLQDMVKIDILCHLFWYSKPSGSRNVLLTPTKVTHPCSACIQEGTECIFTRLSTECIACHKGLLWSCIGGVPDQQILIMPFNNLRPEDDEHVLNLVKDMINLDPFSVIVFSLQELQWDFQRTVIQRSISALVKAKDTYHQHLEANTHELYLFLKICHIVIQQL
ncbi:hypothetical protein IW261DRAFT_1568589 [Armillaria novae-zelandiae]|uniref:Uncharacterized protein n=1 Tax=Armillaria novae-zelandiae TaxID=153914 RepID=A0AA39U589_9AGAR|nr:hypothetical protein IW261DRAFT_1568589 [Armillaria novae-zelandiae]